MKLTTSVQFPSNPDHTWIPISPSLSHFKISPVPRGVALCMFKTALLLSSSTQHLPLELNWDLLPKSPKKYKPVGFLKAWLTHTYMIIPRTKKGCFSHQFMIPLT